MIGVMADLQLAFGLGLLAIATILGLLAYRSHEAALTGDSVVFGRWDLVNFLRGINGQGPSPDVAPGGSPAALAGFSLVGGAALPFAGWYSAGLRRSRKRPQRRPR
jgi:hypothetical protein